MILTILPRSDEAGGNAEAQTKLQTLIDDVLTVVLIIYGESPDTRRILEVAVGRGEAKPQIRRVVWCPDPSVLSKEQKRDYTKKDKVVVVIGLADKIAAALDNDEAQSGLEVEIAFCDAEAQEKGEG
jgi:hypothetical protein